MKKKIIRFVLYGVPLALIIFQLINVFVLPFYLESELLGKIVVIVTILMIISVIIMIYGLNKIGFVTDEINNKFKKCKNTMINKSFLNILSTLPSFSIKYLILIFLMSS